MVDLSKFTCNKKKKKKKRVRLKPKITTNFVTKLCPYFNYFILKSRPINIQK